MKRTLLILFWIATTSLYGSEAGILSPSAYFTKYAPSSSGQKDSYKQHIRKADRLFASRQYLSALAEYKKALEIKPHDRYAEKRISEIYKKTGKKQLSARTYNEKIAMADRYFKQGKYAQAESWYRVASALNPAAQYPKDRIKEIQNKKEKRKAYRQKAHIKAGRKDKNTLKLSPPRPEAISKKADKKLNGKDEESGYQDAIRKGIILIDHADYYKAKRSFERALQFKADDPVAKSKIEAIDDSLSIIAQRRKSYARLIQQGDRHFAQKKYALARKDFSQAARILNKPYPHKKLYEINHIMRKQVTKGKDDYSKLVSEGDKLYAGMLYLQAIDMYQKAGKLDPSADYPPAMIRKIKDLLAYKGLRTIVQSTTRIPKHKKKIFQFKPIDLAHRERNFIYMRLRNLSGKEVKVYFTYGKGGNDMGGYDFRMKAKEEKKVIIPVGKKDKWFSEDNDYLSIYSYSGNLSIEELKILRNDESK